MYVACYSNRSDEINIAFAPAQPANIQFVDSSATEVSFKWDASTNANGYLIYRAVVDANGTASAFEEIAKTTEAQYKDNTVAARTNYQYKIYFLSSNAWYNRYVYCNK